MNIHGGRRARRAAAVLLACGLSASLALAGVVSAAPRSSFSGDFEVVGGDGAVLARVKATTFEPTEQRIVPGTYEFVGVPGFMYRQIHAQVGGVDYWHDPNHPAPGMGGSNVAFAEGVQCAYLDVGVSDCGDWAVMFIDVLDPSQPNQIAFADDRDPSTGDWTFDIWNTVGKGEFNVRVAGG